MDWATIVAVLGVVFTGGAAWGGASYALNGTRKRVMDLDEKFTQHVSDDNTRHVEAIDRLARIETKLDVLGEK